MNDVDRAADVAYGVYHPATQPHLTGKPRAWRGPVETNPMRRAIQAALESSGAVFLTDDEREAAYGAVVSALEHNRDPDWQERDSEGALRYQAVLNSAATKLADANGE